MLKKPEENRQKYRKTIKISKPGKNKQKYRKTEKM